VVETEVDATCTKVGGDAPDPQPPSVVGVAPWKLTACMTHWLVLFKGPGVA
jgi:hypothetical protein